MKLKNKHYLFLASAVLYAFCFTLMPEAGGKFETATEILALTYIIGWTVIVLCLGIFWLIENEELIERFLEWLDR